MAKSDKNKEELSSPKNENKIHDPKNQEKQIDSKKEETPEERIKILEEKLLRTLAETENQRRRFEKERQEAFDFGGFNFARESLALLDNIDRATDSFKNDEKLKNNKDLDKIIEAIEIIKKDLLSIFKKNGIALIECLNKKFDPNFHQAMIEIEDSEKDAGIVVQEIQKGYMMKDRLLRPAMVGVTKKRTQNTEKTNKNEKKDENQ